MQPCGAQEKRSAEFFQAATDRPIAYSPLQNQIKDQSQAIKGAGLHDPEPLDLKGQTV